MFVLNVHMNGRLVHFNIPLIHKVLIGSGQTNTICLPDPSVSSQHASLEERETDGKVAVVVTDGVGTSGTYVNDERIQQRALDQGDTIRLGKYTLEVLKAHKNFFPTFREDPSQKVVFEGDPFTRETALATRLRAIHELCLSVSNVPVPILLECAAATLKRGLTFENFCIMLKGSRRYHTCTTWDHAGPCERSKVEVSSSMIDQCAVTGRAILSENIETDQRFASSESLRLRSVSSAMCVPLRRGDRDLGLIYCTTSDRKRRFTHEDLQFATVVATQIAAALCHGQDLNREKAAAAKLGALFNRIREGVLVCDHDFKILSSNRSALQLLRQEALDGQHLETVLSGLDHTFDRASAVTQESFEVILRDSPDDRVNGEVVQSLHGHVHHTDIPHQAEWRYLVCLLDNTEQRRADQIKIAFVRKLAHKLRTPLTVFIGVMSLLEQHLDGEIDQEIRWLLENGETSCTEMRDLIDRFVSFSSFQPGTEFRGLPFHDISTLIEQGLALASQHAEVGELTIDDQTSPEDFQLSVNRERISFSISQVVHNAAKFAPQSTLTIRAIRDDEGLRLHFIDDGPGIPRAELPRVLGLFHQVDLDRTGQVPGCGIGLWWSLEILRTHGGNLRIDSPDPDTGVGTRVEFVFPEDRVRDYQDA